MDDDGGNVEQCSLKATPVPLNAIHRRLRQIAAISGAVLCLILAALGFFLPLLPCTPFVLLASFMLVHGSPGMHRWLRGCRFFGRILVDWEDRKGIRRGDKVRAIAIVIAGLLLTMVFGNPPQLLRFLVLFFAAIGLWVILRLPLAQESDDSTTSM